MFLGYKNQSLFKSEFLYVCITFTEIKILDKIKKSRYLIFA